MSKYEKTKTLIVMNPLMVKSLLDLKFAEDATGYDKHVIKLLNFLKIFKTCRLEGYTLRPVFGAEQDF